MFWNLGRINYSVVDPANLNFPTGGSDWPVKGPSLHQGNFFAPNEGKASHQWALVANLGAYSQPKGCPNHSGQFGHPGVSFQDPSDQGFLGPSFPGLKIPAVQSVKPTGSNRKLSFPWKLTVPHMGICYPRWSNSNPRNNPQEVFGLLGFSKKLNLL